MKKINLNSRSIALRVFFLSVAVTLSSCSLLERDPLAKRMDFSCDFNISDFRAPGTETYTLESSVALYRWLGPIIDGGIMRQPGFSLAQTISNAFVTGKKSQPNGRIPQYIWLIPKNLTKSGNQFLLEQRGDKILAIQAAEEHTETLGFLDHFYSPRRNFCQL